MNWNKNNNDNNPWGSGGNNNPWGSGGSGDGPNRRDFEDSIRKAKDRFGNFKFGGRRKGNGKKVYRRRSGGAPPTTCRW